MAECGAELADNPATDLRYSPSDGVGRIYIPSPVRKPIKGVARNIRENSSLSATCFHSHHLISVPVSYVKLSAGAKIYSIWTVKSGSVCRFNTAGSNLSHDICTEF